MQITTTIDDAAYRAAVDALFARQPGRMVPGLERITALTDLLGRPDQAYPSVQVTGTNGKTTTAHMVSALLAALGLTAGTYTSPHLQDVRERIRVAGEVIARPALAERLLELSPYLTTVDARFPDRVSFFEALTALAFTHFADAPVDVGVFEVGMGGRWDATNVVRGEVAVLTRIGLDHRELGSTVAEVAAEKTGIVKDGAVVVSSAQAPDAARAIEMAARDHQAKLVIAGRDFGLTDRRVALGGQELDLQGVTGQFDEVFVPLHGAHQAENAACALAAVEGFFGFSGGLDPGHIRQGFAAVRSPGRLEVLLRDDDRPTVVLDGAHNPDGARALALALRSEFVLPRIVLVLGVLADKDVESIVEMLAPVADAIVATAPDSTRAAPSARVVAAAQRLGIAVEAVEGIPQALDRARELAYPLGAVVVTGSLYTVGAARDALGLEPA